MLGDWVGDIDGTPEFFGSTMLFGSGRHLTALSGGNKGACNFLRSPRIAIDDPIVRQDTKKDTNLLILLVMINLCFFLFVIVENEKSGLVSE